MADLALNTWAAQGHIARKLSALGDMAIRRYGVALQKNKGKRFTDENPFRYDFIQPLDGRWLAAVVRENDEGAVHFTIHQLTTQGGIIIPR